MITRFAIKMIGQFVFVALLFGVHGSAIHSKDIRLISSRIIGGEEAADGAYPYQASLRSAVAGRHMCSGSILNRRWILTAAHCTYNLFPFSFTVVVGTNSLATGGSQYRVEKIITDKDFNPGSLHNDVSLVKVSGDIVFSEKVQPITLPVNDTAAGTILTFTGWGATSNLGFFPVQLQVINLTAISVDSCRSRFGGLFDIVDSQICTFTKIGEGPCRGDSGGPLVTNGQVVGVLSYGRPPCARGFPDVYSRVHYYKDWILKIISSD